MSGHLGPVELCCDAPPYEAVRACENLGLHAPLDVRWLRVGNLRKHHRQARPIARWLAWLLRRFRPGRRTCGCHDRLPEMRWYRFVYPVGGECDYVLGQCRRCRTVYWDELQHLLKSSPYAITFKGVS